MKCKCISVALGITLDDMLSWTWFQCCNEEAVRRVNHWEGHQHIKNGETVQIWHHNFRGSNECFCNPNIYKHHGKPPLPPMLDQNPDFTRSVITFAKQNQNELSAEMMCNYLHMVVLPMLLQQRKEEFDDNNFELVDLLRDN
jgi:hypothetical protein